SRERRTRTSRCWRRNARRLSSASASLSSTSRMSISLFMLASFLHGQRESEARAHPRFALRPHPPAVTIDNALDDRQPDSRARILGRMMQALEHLEQLVRILHVEPRPVVLDAVLRPAIINSSANANQRFLASACVFQRVIDQVDPNLPQQ